ncbi:TrkH family potassium uptake protein [Acutalibacter caecimuris]|uniref:TrkH family potassium uptake protein n=1 Tax=Acutalibacter caecimuris TaxID=3093657 RepID=UPI002AC97459|nr:potassium transporter TrkG [Acutalibacter sp. M00118]
MSLSSLAQWKHRAAEWPKTAPPVRVIVASFLLLVILGALLLTLPVSSAVGGFTHPLDALFTATSATCVTGLSVQDTTSHWSVFGQVVILLLIQMGGLGLSTFATGFSLLVRRRLGLREMLLAGEASGGDMPDTAALLKLMLGFTFLCEALGAGLLMLRLVPAYGVRGIWPAVFVAVSAYCNAGFDIWGFVPGNSSMTAFAGDPLVSLAISLLIITGGLGFVVVRDIYLCKIKAPLRHQGAKRLNFHSRICLRATLALLAAGTLGFFLLEYDRTMAGLNFFEKLNAAFFQSVNTRTAGFASVDIGAQGSFTKVLSVALMFVGGCPGSTAGGVKTTTLVVLLITVISTLRGQEEVSVLRHRFTPGVVYKSLTVALLGLAVVFADATALTLLNPQLRFIDLLYEAASAFGTAGLTANVTTRLEPISRLILCVTMFIGRVGPLSFGVSILMRAKSSPAILPEGRMLIG